MLSVQSLTKAHHEQIAELYFLENKDRLKIGLALGLGESIPVSFLTCEPVRKLIRKKSQEMNHVLTREEHIRNLQDIRDQAVAADKPDFKAAVQAELAAGTAAGIYERQLPTVEENTVPAKELTSQQIREQLAKKGLPAPASLEYAPEEGEF